MSGRLPRVAPALVFVAALALYLATAAPGLTWAHGSAADGGSLAAACTLGISQPPGYPTYILLGRLFTLLPVGAVAWRLNLLSALAGAGAVAFTFAAARRLLAQRGLALAQPAALLAAGLLASGRILWSQSVAASTHAVNALFAALALYLAVRLAGGATWRALALLGLMLGLGLGNEQSLGLLVPSLAILAWPGLQHLPLGAWLCFFDGLQAGLAVYLYIPLRLWHWPLGTWQVPTIAWADPERPAAWLRLLLSEGAVPILPGSMGDLAARLGTSLGLAGAQFTWPGVLLAGVGLGRSWQHEGRLFTATAMAAALYGFYALGRSAPEAEVVLLPALLLAALCLAEGAHAVLVQLHWRLPRPALPGATAFLVVLALAVNLPAADLRADRAAERYAEAALAHLPDDAIVLSGSDEHTAALWYAQWALGRPQAHWVVVDTRLLGYPWYRQALLEAHPDLALPGPGAPEPMRALVLANSPRRPVYLADSPLAPVPAAGVVPVALP